MEQRPDKTPSFCQPGQSLGAGHEWVLERLLHRDSSGEVWLAHDRHGAQAPRALRIFTGPGARAWLDGRQGALWTIMHRLWSHPHVVRLLDIGASGQGPPCVATEYVPGGSLQGWLSRPPDRRPALPKMEVLRGAASALAEAHRQGINHGCLTPAGILFTRAPDVRAKVAGFGLCGGGAGPSAATGAAALMYEPPEAFGAPTGTPGRDLSSDDVFAFGVIGYQLLIERLERPPYDFADALAGGGHDAQVIRLIARCLAGPVRRFASAVELEREFGEVGLPQWPPVPARCFDVSQIVREYVKRGDVRTDVKREDVKT